MGLTAFAHARRMAAKRAQEQQVADAGDQAEAGAPKEQAQPPEAEKSGRGRKPRERGQ